MKRIFYFLVIAAFSSSCVSSKKFSEVSQQLDECEKGVEVQAQKIALLEDDTTTLNVIINKLIADTVQQAQIIRQNYEYLETLNDRNKRLSEQLKDSKNESEVEALLADIRKIQNKLIEKEDALSKTEKELNRSGKALSEKSQKLEELSAMVNKQDSLMKHLRKKVTDALIGFVGNGLEVVNKNGKVYVSLEERLLFNSGSWVVDTKGVAALENLAKFLGENRDIHVVIEGHTDDVSYKANGNITDNWDLSVKRATSIVRILLKNKEINPERITASGRAEFVPLDLAKTREARQKNRRTEIILSPNIDELMQALSAE